MSRASRGASNLAVAIVAALVVSLSAAAIASAMADARHAHPCHNLKWECPK